MKFILKWISYTWETPSSRYTGRTCCKIRGSRHWKSICSYRRREMEPLKEEQYQAATIREIYHQRRCKLDHHCHIISTTNMYHWCRKTQRCCSDWHPKHIHLDMCPTQEGNGYNQDQRSTRGYSNRNRPIHLWALCDYISQGGKSTSCSVTEFHICNNDGEYFVLPEVQEEPCNGGI